MVEVSIPTVQEYEQMCKSHVWNYNNEENMIVWEKHNEHDKKIRVIASKDKNFFKIYLNHKEKTRK